MKYLISYGNGNEYREQKETRWAQAEDFIEKLVLEGKTVTVKRVDK